MLLDGEIVNTEVFTTFKYFSACFCTGTEEEGGKKPKAIRAKSELAKLMGPKCLPPVWPLVMECRLRCRLCVSQRLRRV